MNFFHLIFPCVNIFLCFARPPPPPISFRMVRPLMKYSRNLQGCHNELKFQGICKVIGKGRLGIEQPGNLDSSQVKSAAPGALSVNPDETLKKLKDLWKFEMLLEFFS